VRRLLQARQAPGQRAALAAQARALRAQPLALGQPRARLGRARLVRELRARRLQHGIVSAVMGFALLLTRAAPSNDSKLAEHARNVSRAMQRGRTTSAARAMS